MRLCDRQLRRWYRDFNARYFKDELPDEVDLLYFPISDACADVLPDPAGIFMVRIHPMYSLDTNVTKAMLLHEMIHIHLHPFQRHGERFYAEVTRLVIAGAYKGLL